MKRKAEVLVKSISKPGIHVFSGFLREKVLFSQHTFQNRQLSVPGGQALIFFFSIWEGLTFV